jgi:hypothetical protein
MEKYGLAWDMEQLALYSNYGQKRADLTGKFTVDAGATTSSILELNARDRKRLITKGIWSGCSARTFLKMQNVFAE